MKMKRHKLATLLILVLNVSLFGFNPSEYNAISQLEKTDTFQMAIIPIYLDTAYSFEERAADLVSRMTLEEKQAQLINTMPAIPRLGINAYQVWGEALHGLASFFKPIPATSFPNSGALGASWDPDLAQRETSAISDEARGSNYGIISGLTYWSPVVEPARDPRWGRNGESFSEDPFLVSKIASGFVKGFMGDDPRYYKSIPTAKHFTANNSEFNRHDGDSQMDERDLREYYLDPYRNLILRDRIPSIMTAYNSVNGIPITADTFLVDKIVRKNWGMDGYITSDCGGVNDLYAQHKYSKTLAEATAAGLIAGVDCNCGSVYGENAIAALNQQLIKESHIDKALLHIYTIRMKTGEFDPPSLVKYSTITPDVIQSQNHLDLAVEVAEKTPVLLKNDRNILPLDITVLKSLAVIGPKADVVELGPYSGRPSEANKISPLLGIQNYIEKSGANIELHHSAGAGTASASNLCQFTSFEIEAEDGSTKTYEADKYTEGSSTLVLNTASVGPFAVTSIKNVNDGDWAAFENVDLTGAKEIGAYINVPGDGGIIEVRTGSINGNLLATLDYTGMHTGVVSGTNISGRINQIGVSGHQKIFFVFKAPLSQPIDEATLANAKSADVALVFIGTDDRTSAEEADRGSLSVPGNQVELVKAVAHVNPNTIVVMQTVGMVEIESFKDLVNIPGILWYGYNGQAQGTAAANILFGEVNPGGKLHSTWYKSDADLAPITEYHLRGQKGNRPRTYWYYDGPVSYEFGFGMSYTTFEYSNINIDKKEITPNDRITISVDVENTGDRKGDEVVQVYVTTPDSPPELERPIKRLKGFKKVTIPVGSRKTVSIDIDIADLWFWDPAHKRIAFDQGKYVFEIGASSRDIKGKVSAMLSGDFNAELRTVVAESDDVIIGLGDVIQSNVTAALTDDSFYDLKNAQVEYSTNRPDVAIVDSNGLVTAVGSGAALIQASVTMEGKTISGSYPIKVRPDLDLEGIALDNTPIANFSPDQHGYSFLFENNQTAIPAVSAKQVDDHTRISIEQADKIPGTSIIYLEDTRTGERGAYAIYFGYKAVSDEFQSGQLDEKWQWKRHNADSVYLDSGTGKITITAESGDLEGDKNDAKNILCQSANSDWVVETKIDFSRAPAYLGEQAGFLAFADEDNFVKVVCKFSRGGFMGMTQIPRLEIITEVDGSGSTIASLPASEVLSGDNTLMLQLRKEGSQYTAYYASVGEDFIELGTADILLKNVYLGLMAVKGNETFPGLFPMQVKGPDPVFSASFDYFRIDSK
jgi:beta-glucosidase